MAVGGTNRTAYSEATMAGASVSAVTSAMSNANEYVIGKEKKGKKK